MKKILVLTPLFCFAILLYGQETLRKGYLLRAPGDTVKGFIDTKNFADHASYCEFSENGENFARYPPEDIAGYGFLKGESYLAKEVIEGTYKTHAFAEVLVAGRMTLLRVDDQFYLEEAGKPLLHLKKDIKTEVVGQGVVRHELPVYRGVLQWKFAGCKKNIASKIDRSRLDERSLTELFVFYNTCVDPNFRDVKKKVSVRKNTFVGVMAGHGNIELVKFAPSDSRFDLEEFSSGKTSYIGISFSRNNPKFSKHFFLNVEIGYQPMNFTSTKTFSTVVSTVTLDMKSIRFPVSLLYAFNPGKRIVPSLQVGIMPNYFFESKGYFHMDFSTGSEEDGEINFGIQDMTISPFVSAGLQLNVSPRFGAALNFRFETGASNINLGWQRDVQQRTLALQFTGLIKL
jgi:hypothetical protein